MQTGAARPYRHALAATENCDCQEPHKSQESAHLKGGWGGIRTPGSLSTTAVFKTAALNHSATHPKPMFYGIYKNRRA